MTLPPNTNQPQNPENDEEYVIPDAALPDDPTTAGESAPTETADQVAPGADPLAPAAPPVAERPAYVPPVYAPPAHPAADAGQPQAIPPAGYTAPPAPPAPPASSAPYGQQPAPQPQPQAPKTNTLAIVSLVSAFFISLLAIVLGHISLSQIKKTGEGGRGLALAGTILGYVFSFGWIVVIIAVVASAAFVASNVDSIEAEIQQQLEEMEESGELPDEFFGEGDEFAPEGESWDEEPWVGTEYEAFCDAYIMYFSDGEEQEYLQTLADTAPDAELQALWQSLADEWASTGNESQEGFDAFMDRYLDADDEAWELCY